MTSSNRLICAALMLAFLAALPAMAQQTTGPQLSAGLTLGYNGGSGAQFDGRVNNLAAGFPMSMKLGLGFVKLDPGSSTDARRIFINDATNGIPEESGQRWDFRLDFMYPVELLGVQRSYVTFGPRYSRFKANFKYIGGNEDFDVKSNQWGFGTGVEGYFAVGHKVDFVLGAGYDYFPGATLSGHDTSYSPDGDDVNPRNDYTYDTADDAINQPKHNLRFQLGVSYAFGN